MEKFVQNSRPLLAMLFLLLAGSLVQARSQAPTIVGPTPIDTPLPLLSEIAEGCPEYGAPIVRFIVDTDGSTKKHKYLRRTGCAKADRAILTWLRRWQYRPATSDGVPVEKRVTVVVSLSG